MFILLTITVQLVLYQNFLPCAFVNADFYTSTYRMTMLLQEEKNLIGALQNFISEFQNETNGYQCKNGKEKRDEECPYKLIPELKRILNRSVNAQNKIEDTVKYIENPINAFHLLHRFCVDWARTFPLISDLEDNSVAAKDFISTYQASRSYTGGFPTQRDLQGAAEGILRLWNVYQFNLTDFFKGKIHDRITEPLDEVENIHISRSADAKDYRYEAVHWLTNLLKTLQFSDDRNTSVAEKTVARLLAGLYYKEDMVWKSLEVLSGYTQDSDPKIMRDYAFYHNKFNVHAENQAKEVERTSFGGPTKSFYLKYEALCRGETMSLKAKSKLFCYIRSSAVPYWLVKEEVVSNDPRISLFHEVIFQDEIDFLKNESANKIQRSLVVNQNKNDGQGNAVVERRISQTAWLSDLQYPVLRRLSSRIERVTGLETEFKMRHSHSELFQVLNYGVGGMYEPHYDPFGYRLWDGEYPYDPVEMKGSGDRLATWLFYLSDVQVGGATVFPLVNARIPVVKGAAAFWYNFKRNGELDVNTQHAGCPVLLGSKWVSNKWIREEGQMLRRPCGLKENARDTLYTNNLDIQWRS